MMPTPDELMERHVTKLGEEFERAREEAFYAGFKHGMAVQEQIFEDECPEAYDRYYSGRRSERRELVDALEELLEHDD